MNKILFLCPHNAAKSVLAVAYFNQMAEGTNFYADSAGTEPDDAVMPSVASHLQNAGLDVSSHQPRHLTSDDVESAYRVISMGCTADYLPTDKTEQWQIPPVSHNLEVALQAIQENLATLWQSLQEITP